MGGKEKKNHTILTCLLWDKGNPKSRVRHTHTHNHCVNSVTKCTTPNSMRKSCNTNRFFQNYLSVTQRPSCWPHSILKHLHLMYGFEFAVTTGQEGRIGVNRLGSVKSVCAPRLIWPKKGLWHSFFALWAYQLTGYTYAYRAQVFQSPENVPDKDLPKTFLGNLTNLQIPL